jgi:cobalamin synthase
MSGKFNSDIRFFAIGIIGGVITLILPVIMWNVWFLNYIDSHGKLIAYCLAPVFAAISAGIFVGFSYAKRSLTGIGRDGKQVNPFWGWAGVALAIEVIFVALSNT